MTETSQNLRTHTRTHMHTHTHTHAHTTQRSSSAQLGEHVDDSLFLHTRTPRNHLLSSPAPILQCIAVLLLWVSGLCASGEADLRRVRPFGGWKLGRGGEWVLNCHTLAQSHLEPGRAPTASMSAASTLFFIHTVPTWFHNIPAPAAPCWPCN